MELEVLELREQAVAEHLGGDAGAVRDEEYRALRTVRGDRYHFVHTGVDARRQRRQVAEVDPALAGAVIVGAARASSPKTRAMLAYSANCAARVRGRHHFDGASPPASRNSPSSRRMSLAVTL